jgi:hypothetical protein
MYGLPSSLMHAQRAVALLLLAVLSGSLATPAAAQTPPRQVRMTWFGITNWHYQIGDLGIMLDGAVSFRSEGLGKQEINPALVDKVHDALRREGGSIDVMLLGHKHADHSIDSSYWALKTKARFFAPAEACAEVVAAGVPAAQCTAIVGGEVLRLNPYVTMRVVRWNHSVTYACRPSPNVDFKTYAFLFTVDGPGKQLSFFVSDSGAGAEIMKDRIDDGVNRGSPLGNLFKAARDAGITSFEVWQAGPETSLVAQARIVVPAFVPKYFIPHHMGNRGGYDLLGGMHYPYQSAPLLDAFLKNWNVPQVVPQNYFDAWIYDAGGLRLVDNAAVKTALGLPASGPGPKQQGVNPELAKMECPGD